MAITTYTELKTAVVGFLDRTDLTARVPEFIALAEAALNRELRTNDQLASTTLPADSATLALPQDLREVKAVRIASTGAPLKFRDIDQMDEQRPRFSTTGTPCFYGVAGLSLEFLPAVSGAAPVDIFVRYFRAVPALTDSATTNWLLTKHPDAYLYGALIHSAPYLREDDRVPLWVEAFTAILESIRQESDRALFPAGVVTAEAYG